MFPLSDRCALLRDEAVSAKSYVKNDSAQKQSAEVLQRLSSALRERLRKPTEVLFKP